MKKINLLLRHRFRLEAILHKWNLAFQDQNSLVSILIELVKVLYLLSILVVRIMKESQRKQSNVHTVDVGIGGKDDFVIAKVLDVIFDSKGGLK